MGYPTVAKGNKVGEKAKRPHPGIPLNKSDIASLIVKTSGNLSRVADTMGATRSAVRNVVNKDEELKQLLKDCRERYLDDLEETVFQRAIDSTDTTLQLFVLKTQARDRGWEQSECQNAAKDIATAAFDFIISKQGESSKVTPSNQ